MLVCTHCACTNRILWAAHRTWWIGPKPMIQSTVTITRKSIVNRTKTFNIRKKKKKMHKINANQLQTNWWISDRWNSSMRWVIFGIGQLDFSSQLHIETIQSVGSCLRATLQMYACENGERCCRNKMERRQDIQRYTVWQGQETWQGGKRANENDGEKERIGSTKRRKYKTIARNAPNKKKNEKKEDKIGRVSWIFSCILRNNIFSIRIV